MVTAFSPTTFVPRPSAHLTSDFGGAPLFMRSRRRGVVVEWGAAELMAKQERLAGLTRFTSFKALTPLQLLLPLPAPEKPSRIEDPKTAAQLGVKLGRVLRYLTVHLAKQNPLEMTMIRALSQFILAAERTQMSETARSSFEDGFRSAHPPRWRATNGEARLSLQARAVMDAKLLILLTLLKNEDPFLGDYAPLTTTSNPQTFFDKLASLMVGLDQLIARFEAGKNPNRLEAMLKLERTFWALESFFPWARTLFPDETRSLDAQLSVQGLTVRGFIADGKTRVANARMALHRLANNLP